MIDLELMTRLFQSLRPGGRLILMGDPWQLPPVEAGAPFAPLVEKSPGMALTRCMRTDLKAIVELAEAIKQQDFSRLMALLKDPAAGIEWIPHTELTFTITEKMILTPLKKGHLGSQALNQKGLKEGKEGPYPILITQNHHELELYNGDIGLLESLDIKPGVKARFGERVIPALLLPPWDFAWALSIHKSQGSEFDHLRLLLPDEAQGLSFKALYTGVTRAKKSCSLHATEEALKSLFN
jgi:exodeoxyribonuclease V alpha subunit